MPNANSNGSVCGLVLLKYANCQISFSLIRTDFMGELETLKSVFESAKMARSSSYAIIS